MLSWLQLFFSSPYRLFIESSTKYTPDHIYINLLNERTEVMGKKTCDIVYVQPHWRGFAGGSAYPVVDYWRGNGSAYKGSHSPVRAVSRRFDSKETSTVKMNGYDVPAPSFRDKVRESMNNTAPEVYLANYDKVREKAEQVKDYGDLSWLEKYERMQEQVAKLADESQMDGVGMPIYALDKKNGGYLTDGSGHPIIVGWKNNAILHKTPKGSTLAVSPNGTIESIVVAPGDNYTYRTMLAKAVSAGGVKIDAYEQDNDLYMAAGFVPVAWVETKEKDYPEGFDPSKDYSCDEILYLHASECDPEDVKLANDLTIDEWKALVKPNRSKKDAIKRRDDYQMGDKKIRYEQTMKEERQARREAKDDMRWARPSLDVCLGFTRKKSAEQKEEISNNWSDWENSFDYEKAEEVAA